MTEQPKTSETKRLKLHHKAMQVIPEWINDWELRHPPNKVAPGLLHSLSVSSLRNLDQRLKATFQQDEQIRADLLAACEAALLQHDNKGITCFGLGPTVVADLRAAIAKAKAYWGRQ